MQVFSSAARNDEDPVDRQLNGCQGCLPELRGHNDHADLLSKDTLSPPGNRVVRVIQ